MDPTSRASAEALDASDPLASFVAEFVVDDPELVYLDGNSLGRLPRRTRYRLARAVTDEWGGDLVRGWHRWIDLPRAIGDRIGETMLGAQPGQTVVGDSTTVNLYKLAWAALAARPDRHTISTLAAEFPTDRYVLEGLAAATGRTVRLDGGTDTDTALVVRSVVDYRTGELADVARDTAAAHDAGAIVLWDLCHAVGAVPLDLDTDDVDLAVGCTYKYLNAGPGSPAFLYVARRWHGALRQPIWGWFGQRDQFAMGPQYDPVLDVGQFVTGTPPVLQLLAVAEGTELLADAGIEAVRAKGRLLTSLLVELADAWLAPLGFEVATPRDPDRRGNHVALRHADAYRIGVAAIEEAALVPDVRPPDLLRLGPAPLSTRFVDVWDGLDRLRRLVESGAHLRYDEAPGRVT